jgi:hypothetical protein
MAGASANVKAGRLDKALDVDAELARAHRLIRALQRAKRRSRQDQVDIVRTVLEGAPNWIPSARSQVTAERIVDALKNAGPHGGVPSERTYTSK